MNQEREINPFDIRKLVRPEIAELDAYTPIVPFEVLSRRLGIPVDRIVKLDANENPYGPSPAVIEALAEYNFYHIYPDPQQHELRDALSTHVGVPAANILPGHGVDELLDYICRILLTTNDAIVDCPPTFGMYGFDARLAGAHVIQIERKPDFSVDIPAIKRAVAEPEDRSSGPWPKILFLTSPNNPSGNWLADADLECLLRLPVLVVLDEAYVEFADRPSRLDWVLAHENLVVFRTFSKAAGIAGLRLGYGIYPDWLMEALWKFKQPYNVNVAATVAGLASLRDQVYLHEVVERIKAERERLYARLTEVAFVRPYPSQANFILCEVRGRDARALKLSLETYGILVRHYHKAGLENCIRISVGRPDQTDRLLDALARV